ncbi:MAG: hypothetical protein H6828_14275 [Planctomycetes bacterium]|nr:hypothetical protein [Planctomycetota bacterium]
MASSGELRLTDIERALEVCLPGCRWVLGVHRWHIYPPGGGAAFYLPKGGHGAGRRAVVQRGHVRKLARQFDVLACMQAELDAL